MEMLRALRDGNDAEADVIRTVFRPLEDLRNNHGPIPTLHHAVSLAGIAETGPHYPLLSSLPDPVLTEIGETARRLHGTN